MNRDEEKSKDFLNMMTANNYIPHIIYPTRITNHSATLIDNIFVHHTTKPLQEDIKAGNLMTDISRSSSKFFDIWTAT